MDFELSEEHKMLADTARRFMESKVEPVADQTEEQQNKYLPPLCSGEKIGALALTESNAVQML